MKKNKEVIEEIIDRLQTIKDFEYKEGAWERFKTTEGAGVAGRKIRHINRYIAAAAMLLVGLGVSYFLLNSQKDSSKSITDATTPLLVDTKPIQEVNKEYKENDKTVVAEVSDNAIVAVGAGSVQDADESAVNLPYLTGARVDHKISVPQYMDGLRLAGKESLDNKDYSIHHEVSNPVSTKSLLDHLVLANSSLANSVLTGTNSEKSLGPKSFKYGDRFDLGIYVSPYSSTTDNLKVGAGFTLAYNITNKISVRTGASYNSYEVGVMKDPLSASSVEKIKTTVSNSVQYDSDGRAALTQMSKVSVPNINAITGFVKSVEIPLEVKYNMNRSLYATAGVSYSTIINQERNAQYVENVNLNTFSNGFPENEAEASKALQAVTKTVKSSEKNVNTNGYTGFVNFSVGKKVNVNKKFGISVEPYFKIPVGEFRRADMNYTNGGVRIMTSF